ncbi:MAG: hypothetical protein ACLT0Y_04480 [Christensenellales bacterium]
MWEMVKRITAFFGLRIGSQYKGEGLQIISGIHINEINCGNSGMIFGKLDGANVGFAGAAIGEGHGVLVCFGVKPNAGKIRRDRRQRGRIFKTGGSQGKKALCGDGQCAGLVVYGDMGRDGRMVTGSRDQDDAPKL